MRLEQPFHEGELFAQQRAGELEAGQRNGRGLADSIMTGALKFVAQQPMVVLGSVGADGRLWASVLFGQAGFATAPDERRVEFDLSGSSLSELDPFWTNIEHDPRVGTLFLEMSTRRRVRINGTAERASDDLLTLDVLEAFANCPKYIQRREIDVESGLGDRSIDGELIEGGTLGDEQVDLISRSDTFFVASAHTERGVDVSHRGGLPGFVQVVDGRTLRIPDYAGNSMFNTLGNLTINPQAGLVFIDFENGRMLQLTGTAEIQWADEDAEGQSAGTGRFWTLQIERWRQVPIGVGVRWQFVDYSPHNPLPSDARVP